MKGEIIDLKKFRAKEELKILIMRDLISYVSLEEPNVNLTKEDKVNILAQLIVKLSN